MTDQVMHAHNLKGIGNSLFKEKKFEQAAEAYHDAAMMLLPPPEKDEDTGSLTTHLPEDPQVCELAAVCLSNEAQSRLELKEFKTARYCACLACTLDSRNMKTYYRAARAYIALESFALAEERLLMVLTQGNTAEKKDAEALLTKISPTFWDPATTVQQQIQATVEGHATFSITSNDAFKSAADSVKQLGKIEYKDKVADLPESHTLKIVCDIQDVLDSLDQLNSDTQTMRWKRFNKEETTEFKFLGVRGGPWKHRLDPHAAHGPASAGFGVVPGDALGGRNAAVDYPLVCTCLALWSTAGTCGVEDWDAQLEKMQEERVYAATVKSHLMADSAKIDLERLQNMRDADTKAGKPPVEVLCHRCGAPDQPEYFPVKDDSTWLGQMLLECTDCLVARAVSKHFGHSS